MKRESCNYERLVLGCIGNFFDLLKNNSRRVILHEKRYLEALDSPDPRYTRAEEPLSDKELTYHMFASRQELRSCVDSGERPAEAERSC